jgi:hypothetical protein
MENPSKTKGSHNPLPHVSRRTFLEVTAGLFAAYSGTAVAGDAGKGNAVTAAAKLQEFETPLCTLRLDPITGNLCGTTWKHPQLEVIQESALGENFRLRFPHPGYEANYFLSSHQKVSRIEARPDGVTCHYDSLRNAREEIKVKAAYHLRAVEGRLEFSLEIENATEFPLAEVFFGIIGGQNGLFNREDTESLVPGLYTNRASNIFRGFSGSYGGGNLGIRYSAQGFLYSGFDLVMGWTEFYNPKANVGLYYAYHDPEPRLAGIYYELRPFTKTAVVGDQWPTSADVPAGEPIGLTMGWLNFPFAKERSSHFGPVALQVHSGDWHEGSVLYRHWFDQHFQVRRRPKWLRQEMAWQSVIISNCEDEVLYRYQDWPKLAADAKKYDVTTFEILGWNVGGIDRGYPQYTPDPRLGTHEEFRQALAAIRRLGVHPLLFANIQVADTATPLFKEKLHRFAVMGEWAPDYLLMGWGEGTISAHLSLTSSNMTLVSPSHPEYRKFLVDLFVELVRDGAQGFQLDKAGITSLLDFNPELPTSPDRSLPEGLLLVYADLTAKAREVDPEVAIASEMFWDRAFPFVDVSYARMNDIDMPTPALKYTFPEWTSTICAESPGDFNVINNGMRYGLVWAVQPRHYNDSMDEPLTRPLSRYVQELIRIRSKHKELLFFGRFRDTLGAQVTGGANVRYSVFEGLDKPGKACVVVNFGNEEETVEVAWPGGEGNEVEVLAPFQPDEIQTLPAKVRLAPRTCAVIAQKT